MANRYSNVKRPIIIGATGSLGRMLDVEARTRGWNPVSTTRSVRSGLVSFDVLQNELPDVVPDLGSGDCVYLAFGLTNLNWVHAHPHESRMVNVEATMRVADRALDRGARVVFISSEQVFDGRQGGYDEAGTPNPLTEYGRQKAEVENRLVDRGGRDGDWIIVRTGATVTDRFGENCAAEKTYTTLLSAGARMASDNIISLTPARSTISALLALAERGERGIYHFVAAPPVSRAELAQWILADSRLAQRMTYTETTYATIPFPEPRPLRSYMIASTTCRRLGIDFPSAREAVRHKVSLLDSRFESENLK